MFPSRFKAVAFRWFLFLMYFIFAPLAALQNHLSTQTWVYKFGTGAN